MLVPRGRYRAKRAWGRDAWKAERDKEQANKVAQRVRRAAALTAELAAQSEKKTAAVCDQPPGLDELAGHIEAPNMGTGGSHSQAAMMPDPWATYSRPSASDNQAMTRVPPETDSRVPANRRPFALAGRSRDARPRSVTRILSTRTHAKSAHEELRQVKHVEQERRLHHKKEEAWELFKRQPSLRPRTREEFEEKFRQKVLSGIWSSSKDEQEKDLQKWLNELQEVADLEERKLEAMEVRRMGEEDAHFTPSPSLEQDLPAVPRTHSRGKLGASAATSLQSTYWTRIFCFDMSLASLVQEAQADLSRNPVALMYQPILNTGAHRGTMNVSIIYTAFMQYSFEQT